MVTKLKAAIAAGVLVTVVYFWPRPAAPVATPTARSGPDGYIDSAVCAECHAAIAKSYAETGMARTFGAMRASSMFPDGRFQHAASEETFSMSRRDGKAFVKRESAGAEREAGAHFWFGSGNRGRGFLSRAASGRLLLLPVTYYSEDGGHWGMNPGYDRAAHAGFERVADYRCMSCHAGYPAVEPGADLQSMGWEYPGKLVEGIDCQRCHGPGQKHVEAFRQSKPLAEARAAIVNPERLPRDRQMDVCMQCYLETTSVLLPNEIIRFGRGVFSYRPGESLGDWLTAFDFEKGSGHDDRFEFVSSVYRLRQSACFRESQGEMTCSTCHNPHDIPKGAKADAAYKAACLKCHDGKMPGPPPAQECTSCHMPKRTPSDAIHLRLSDHFIQKRAKLETQRPVSEPVLKPYRGEVVTYYPAVATSEQELYAAVAQVTQQANLVKGTARLEALIKRHNPAHGEFYLQLGNAWSNLNQPEKARPWLEEAVRRMPGQWRPVALLAAVTADRDSALSMLRRAAAMAPKEAAPWIQIGNIETSRDTWSAAIAAFQEAIRIVPESAEAHHYLGRAYAAAGDGEAALRALREAVRLRAEASGARAELATLLAIKGDFGEARQHFELSLRQDPANGSARAAFATALAENGLKAEARTQFQQVLRSTTDPELRKEAQARLGELK